VLGGPGAPTGVWEGGPTLEVYQLSMVSMRNMGPPGPRGTCLGLVMPEKRGEREGGGGGSLGLVMFFKERRREEEDSLSLVMLFKKRRREEEDL